MATSRRLQSDSGAFGDWVASSSSNPSNNRALEDLSLGFNAGPQTGSTSGPGIWPPSGRQINYNLSPEMGMFVVPSSVIADHHVSSIIPLFATTPNTGMCFEEDNINNRKIQFWQAQTQQNQTHTQHNYLKKPINFEPNASLLSSGGGSATCQDCGNQAKKDCTHRRCRTCCKSRGFDCVTHVKSTWVPAARRRERQLMGVAGAGTGPGSSGSTSGTKKPRLTSQTTTTSHTSTSNTTPPRSFETSSSHQDASFKEGLPGQVRAPAVFKCVRVTAVDDGDDEYAYQAVVKIGGHVFKGFLYDQGVETRDGFLNISELHLGGGGSGGGASGGDGGGNGPATIDPSDVYATSGGGLLGGSTYGNPISG